MTLSEFKEKLQFTPAKIEFTDTMQVIEANYKFHPTAFKNGELHNMAGENSGSCKLFAFAIAQGFTKNEALVCFGKFYAQDVLQDPTGSSHQNIRNFIKTGFEGLSFEGEALEDK